MNFNYQDKINICEHYDLCGGCNSLDVEYNKQIQEKKERVKQYYLDNDIMEFPLSQVIKSPDIYEYRNHMELSFGDLEIGGKLQLGLHPRGKRYEVVTIHGCFLIDEDFRKIITTMTKYFRNTDLKKYHIKRREGFLRNVKLRKGINTGEILINLITTSQRNPNLNDLVEKIKSIEFKDKLVGFIHTINDDYADAVKADQVNILYGQDHFYEKLLGYMFKISPLDFFQVNTKAAEKLYEIVIEHINNSNNEKVYDLYSGTGSIAQVISPHVKEVIGIELDKSAVKQAEANLALNDVKNCKFIQGDVREVLKQEKEPVNKVIVDPPRPGLHSEVTRSIVDIAPEEIIYVSCNPKTQAQDLKKLLYNNYHIEDIKLVDMFPHTKHIESVAFVKKD